MLFDIGFFTNTAKMDSAYSSAKELFGQHRPYTTRRRLSGTVIVFNTHFTDSAIEAFKTDCITKLSPEEGKFLLHFIDWQNFLLTDPLNPITAGSVEDTFVSSERDALEAFNNWLVDEVAGTPHPDEC